MTFIPVKSRPGSNVYIAHLQEKIRSKKKHVRSKKKHVESKLTGHDMVLVKRR